MHQSARSTGPGLVRRAVAGAAALVAGAALVGCSTADKPPRQPVAAASSSAPGPAAVVPAEPPALHAPTGPVPFDAPVLLQVTHGRLASVRVDGDHGAGPLAGQITADGRSWRSSSPPAPGATYVVSVTALDAAGTGRPLTGRFQVRPLPESQRLTLDLSPGDGEVVGVGAPVVIRFDQHVSDRAAVEKALVVTASRRLSGSWHWVNDRELHFRPQAYWPAGTTVDVALRLTGVRAGEHLWGGRNYHARFTVGPSHVSLIDARRHTMSVLDGGRRIATWPVSLGRPEFATRNGTYIVIGKDTVRRMTSCSAGITCDKRNPNWYDLEVRWDVRLTWTGTFVHAAPWSVSHQGRENVSHGCINLSEARGKAFYSFSRYGDVVTVTGSSRGPADLIRSGDPGMADWNLSWSRYVEGSALHAPVVTGPLPSSASTSAPATASAPAPTR